MKQTCVFIAIILVMGLAIGCDREWTGTVKGVVTDTETELGIPNVLVTVHSQKNQYEVNVLTNSDGEYTIDNARWGPNRVDLYHPRYEQVLKYVDIIRDETVELDFQIDRLTEYIDPTLYITVLNENGDPVNQARIDLYEWNETTYESYVYLGSTESAEDGSAGFYMPRMYEDEILEYQFRVSALGYQDLVLDFVLSWTNPEPSITLVLEIQD